jgi:hypothetical protein
MQFLDFPQQPFRQALPALVSFLSTGLVIFLAALPFA